MCLTYFNHLDLVSDAVTFQAHCFHFALISLIIFSTITVFKCLVFLTSGITIFKRHLVKQQEQSVMQYKLNVMSSVPLSKLIYFMQKYCKIAFRWYSSLVHLGPNGNEKTVELFKYKTVILARFKRLLSLPDCNTTSRGHRCAPHFATTDFQPNPKIFLQHSLRNNFRF